MGKIERKKLNKNREKIKEERNKDRRAKRKLD